MGCSLYVPTERKELPAGEDPVVSTEPDFHTLLDSAAPSADWRLIEVFSQVLLPFELRLGWTGGGSHSAQARLTIPGAGRICIYARHVLLRAANLATVVNPVVAAAADAFLETRNHYEWSGACDGATPLQIPVPPYAQFVHIHIDDDSIRGSTLVTFRDARLQTRAQVNVGALPSVGMPLGGTRRIDVQTGTVASVRALFTLCL